MARRARLPAAPAIAALISPTGTLEVRVTPNARAEAICLPEPGAAPIVSVRTTATPEDGKANAAVIALLAKALGVAKSDISLVRGGRSATRCCRSRGGSSGTPSGTHAEQVALQPTRTPIGAEAQRKAAQSGAGNSAQRDEPDRGCCVLQGGDDHDDRQTGVQQPNSPRVALSKRLI